MKSSRFQHEYRQNASKGHKKIGELLRSGPFAGFKIYQEYPVQKVNKTFKDGRCHFDWVILDLQVVIEVHGEQHYKSVRWGNITEEEAQENLRATKYRDSIKEDAAIQAGFGYVVVKHDELEKITTEQLLERCKAAIIEAPPPVENAATDDKLEKQRAYRKAQYQKFKERAKQRQLGE